ncbi:hypothetical protein ACQKFM_29290 [Paenibacillus xylanexedens]|uniref:hypothetical protein n=1 Tax=Paenibacillus xylanexedens TaxID=528191 RepID=UPI003D0900F3
MDFADVKEYVEFAYYISGILLLIGVVIAIEQLKMVKKDMRDTNYRAAVEKSVEYLTYYAQKFIPAYTKYKEKLKEEMPERIDTKHLFDGNFNIELSSLDKEIVVELIIKQEAGLGQLFNEMEFFSIAILERLVIDDLMFTPVARSYCKIIEEEHVLLSVMRNKGTPFKNVVELYNKWNDRLEVQALELQKSNVENKIKLKGNNHKSKPPIGTS